MVIRTYYFPATVFDLLLLHLKTVTILFCENIIGFHISYLPLNEMQICEMIKYLLVANWYDHRCTTIRIHVPYFQPFKYYGNSVEIL